MKNMLRYKTKTRPGLVALYDIRPGNGAGPFLQPRSPHGALLGGLLCDGQLYCQCDPSKVCCVATDDCVNSE